MHGRKILIKPLPLMKNIILAKFISGVQFNKAATRNTSSSKILTGLLSLFVVHKFQDQQLCTFIYCSTRPVNWVNTSATCNILHCFHIENHLIVRQATLIFIDKIKLKWGKVYHRICSSKQQHFVVLPVASIQLATSQA